MGYEQRAAGHTGTSPQRSNVRTGLHRPQIRIGLHRRQRGEHRHMARPTEQWGTRIGVIMAVAGSAVGLGNFLRFPATAAANGGGVFMIPYFCALLLLGIPICWAEWTMGKAGGRLGLHSCSAILGHLGGHRAGNTPALGLLMPTVVYLYYVVIESWCLGYAWSYLCGTIDLGSDPAEYAKRSAEVFSGFAGDNFDGVMFNGTVHTSVYFWLIVVAANFWLIYRGISKGIEKFCNLAMPIMAVCAIFVLIRVLTLPAVHEAGETRTVLDGLGFMWNPKPVHEGQSALQALADPKVWLAAAGQVFFTLSVGFGVIVTYASYIRPKEDIVLTSTTAISTNEFFEVCLGGLITLPAAFIFLGVVGASKGTFGLAFNTLPIVFQNMPGGRLFGFLWFFMLFLAAITSSVSLLQPVIAFLEEAANVTRRVGYDPGRRDFAGEPVRHLVQQEFGGLEHARLLVGGSGHPGVGHAGGDRSGVGVRGGGYQVAAGRGCNTTSGLDV